MITMSPMMQFRSAPPILLEIINYTNESNEFEYVTTDTSNGINVMPNSDFSDGNVDGWTGTSNGAPSYDAGRMKVSYALGDNFYGASYTASVLNYGGISRVTFTIEVQAQVTAISVYGDSGGSINVGSTSGTYIVDMPNTTENIQIAISQPTTVDTAFWIDDITVDAVGVNILTNQGSGSTTYDGLLNTGESLEVGPNQEFDIPLDYTLGASDYYSGTTSAAGGIIATDLTGGDWNIAATSTGNSDWVEFEEIVGTYTGAFIIEFTATINTTSVTFDRTYGGGVIIPLEQNITIVNGVNRVAVPWSGLANRGFFLIAVHSSGAFDIDMTSITVKQMTMTTNAIPIYNTTTASWDYPTVPSATAYTIPQGTYGHIAVLATEPDATDKAYLEANIHALADLWFDRPTGLASIVKADMQHFYIPKIEQGLTLFDLVGGYGTERTTDIHSNDTSTSGTTTASGFISASFVAWKAFDQLDNTGWIYAVSQLPNNVWIKYEFNTYIKLNTFRWMCENNARAPKAYIIEGSNDNISWDTLYTETSQPAFSGPLEWTPLYTIASSNKYKYIRMNISEVQSDVTYVSVNEIEFNYQVEDAITIPNYTEDMYLNADINPKGQQTTPIVFDATGRATAVDYENLNIYGDAFTNTQWSESTPFTLTENGSTYTSTTKSMPYAIDDLSADGVTPISQINEFKIQE